jgi:hypothetical protein
LRFLTLRRLFAFSPKRSFKLYPTPSSSKRATRAEIAMGVQTPWNPSSSFGLWSPTISSETSSIDSLSHGWRWFQS